MTDCLLDLVLRTEKNDLPPVQAQLTVVAGVRTLAGGDEWAPGDWAPETWPTEVRAACDRWWGEVEARALRGEWGGAESPPVEELARTWAEQWRWQLLPLAEDLLDPREATEYVLVVEEEAAAPRQADTGWWATAHDAVDAAGAAMLELERAMGRAGRAVADAQRADANDEAAWQPQHYGPGQRRGEHPRRAGRGDRPATSRTRRAARRRRGRHPGRPAADRDRRRADRRTAGTHRQHRAAPAVPPAGVGVPPQPCRWGHELTGQPGLGPPGPTDRYRPGAALDRWVRARDRRCPFPGCRCRVPLGGELDHDHPWPEGPTSATNLTGYCTGHPRGKHQAPGWRHELAPDGTLTVTTPTGLTAVTDPPSF